MLIDLLAALNAGPQAVQDLESALADILQAFRPGSNSLLTSLFRPRIDRILLAATKADHLHHTNHDRLEAMLKHVARGAIARAEAAGASVDAVALASVRATREATISRGAEVLPCIVGVPQAGEKIGGELFDGETEAAVFPGDLPADPASVYEAGAALSALAAEGPGLRFVRFRPPRLVPTAEGARLTLPHIRLDRAIEFLIGDRLA